MFNSTKTLGILKYQKVIKTSSQLQRMARVIQKLIFWTTSNGLTTNNVKMSKKWVSVKTHPVLSIRQI